ncbi:unnamed protein product [Lasius platythorax]|uniref:Uncharacterized protein n=1 Tax=Lasius platythorax TaxID=488582 RepID=A0AAV2N042_9HYME
MHHHRFIRFTYSLVEVPKQLSGTLDPDLSQRLLWLVLISYTFAITSGHNRSYLRGRFYSKTTLDQVVSPRLIVQNSQPWDTSDFSSVVVLTLGRRRFVDSRSSEVGRHRASYLGVPRSNASRGSSVPPSPAQSMLVCAQW